MPKQKNGQIEDYISQAEAARMLGLSRASVSFLVANEKLRSKEMAGRRAVLRADVEAYKPRAKSKKPATKKGKAKK